MLDYYLLYRGHLAVVADVTTRRIDGGGVARRLLSPLDPVPPAWAEGGGRGCLIAHNRSSGRASYTEVEVSTFGDGVACVYPCPPAVRVYVGKASPPPADPAVVSTPAATVLRAADTSPTT